MNVTKESIKKSLICLKEANIPAMLMRVTFRSKSQEGPISQYISILVNTQTEEIVKVDPKYMGNEQASCKNIFIEILSDVKTFETKKIVIHKEKGLDENLKQKLQKILDYYLEKVMSAN